MDFITSYHSGERTSEEEGIETAISLAIVITVEVQAGQKGRREEDAAIVPEN